MRPEPARAPADRGFSLLEVTVALGVFGLLVAGAFGLAAGSIELTRELSGFETRELARTRLLQLCRATFRELPGTARFRLTEGDAPGRAGGAAAARSQLLVVSGHPRAFPVGLANPAGEAFASWVPALTLLSSRPDGAGGLMLQLHHLAGEDATRFEEARSLAGLQSDPLSLMRGIQQVRWRFYDAQRQEWVDRWDEEGRRPRFIELNLQLQGDKRPSRSVFWVPEAHLPKDFPPLPAAPPASPPAGENPPPGAPPESGANPGTNPPALPVEAPAVTVQP